MLNQFYEAPDSLYNEKKEKPKTEKESLVRELEKTIMRLENSLRFTQKDSAKYYELKEKITDTQKALDLSKRI